MYKTNIKRILCVLFITISLVSTTTVVSSTTSFNEDDLDPLVDVVVTVEIQQIRSLEKFDWQIPTIEKIDWLSNPDFYVKVFINDVEFISRVWHNTKYIYDPQWSATLNVPEDEEFVNIKIQLWDWNVGINKLCDISRDYDGFLESFDVEVVYDLKTGHWFGHDYISNDLDNPASIDPSGYGRLNGCDDGSIYQRDRDCELWFDIYQNDYDGDGIPYWTEVNVYGTNPEFDNTGEDADHDGVPIEWEHKWGQYFWYNWHDDSWEREWFYDPFEWEDHANLDLDQDGLDNVEEYLTSQWGSDPFRKDIFTELDQMEESPQGEKSLLPERSKELLYTAFDRQNVVYHLDDGSWDDTGSEMIPFDEATDHNELKNIYRDYFLHGDENNWRRGVFHYGVLIYNCLSGGGFVFGNNRFQISTKYAEKKASIAFRNRDVAYASAYMHEGGHTLGIFHENTPGCDDQKSIFPWQRNWWKWRPYKSVMNYGYMYQMVDYSDGSRGKNDFDDWNRIDLTFFQREMW